MALASRVTEPLPFRCCCQQMRLGLLVVVCVPVIRQLRQQLLRQGRIARP